MKQATKRIKALVLAMVMMIAMVMPNVSAMAATSIQTTTLKISGIEAKSTVYAYAIALAALDDNGNTYWKYGNTTAQGYLEDGSLSDDELIYFYTNLNAGTGSDAHDGGGAAVVDKKVLTLTEDGDYYVAENVLPGVYVITASSPTATYNSTVVSIGYTYGTDGTATVAETTVVAVKSSSNPTITKTVDGASCTDNYIGDTVVFTIEITVPSYDSSWETNNLEFWINDALSDGLSLNTSSIEINGTAIDSALTNSKSTYTATALGFNIYLFGADVFNNAGSTITITYSATVTSKAGVNFDAETNTATLKYSTEANGTDLSDGTEVETYHYTFGIDTTLNGTSSTTTTEITKYGVSSTNTSSAVALAGAKFQLTNSDGNVLNFTSAGVYTTDTSANNYVTTGSNGQLVISGIDAGTYTLTELEAPEGIHWILPSIQL